MQKIKKILIVNRGEIAVRIISACRELGIKSATIYSEADRTSLHTRLSDETYLIGPPPASESYLNIKKIIRLAKEIKADAIHPGYGFLSENAEFIKAVEEAGIIFIGPSSKSVELMGSKTAARELMQRNNVPIVPGTTKSIESVEEALLSAKQIGFPVMLKAAAGGGGKGMRLVYSENELAESLERAQNESQKAFGSSEIYMEKFIENPKHIEVQILGDQHGNYIHLFERECSIQRRHQKVVEESPSTFVDGEVRRKITDAAINAAKACNYYNAGTIEFLMDKDHNFYFLEMNTRLQVEHPVTELITGVDLVKEQINIAEGNELSYKQRHIKMHGHAIECRVYAEDIENNFAPSIGKIKYHSLPGGPGIRVDRGIDSESEIPIYYDPLLSKVVTWGSTRTEAIERMKKALEEYKIVGVTTNVELFNWILNHKTFLDGSFDNNFLDKEFLPLVENGEFKPKNTEEIEEVASLAAALIIDKEKKSVLSEIKLNGQNNWITARYE